MKIYKIRTKNENGDFLYFNRDLSAFTGKFPSCYRGKRATVDGLDYAKKCASSQAMIDNLEIIEN